MKIVSLDDVIELLIERGNLKGREQLPLDLPMSHGGCCQCRECGHYHDECVCGHNELLAALNELEEPTQP